MNIHTPLLALCSVVCVASFMVAPLDVSACQPPPHTGYITTTLPRDGGEAGIDDDMLALKTPIAVRWSEHEQLDALGSFYIYGDFPNYHTDVVSSFEVVAEGSASPHPGTLIVSNERREARFIPTTSLAVNTRYTAVVILAAGDSYTWTFTTSSSPSYMDMPSPFEGIVSLSLKEKAYRRYVYCTLDQDVLSCGFDSRHQGWDYRPALYVGFDASDSMEHGAELYRYVLYHHSSPEDLEGTLDRHVDVRTAGPHTIEIERPKQVGGLYCYSLHYLYGYGLEPQTVSTSAITCHQATDLVQVDRLPDPDYDPRGCVTPGDPDMDVRADMGPDMNTSSGMPDGWELSDELDADTADAGCGCTSTREGSPGSGGLMLMAVSLCAGGLMRRRKRS